VHSCDLPCQVPLTAGLCIPSKIICKLDVRFHSVTYLSQRPREAATMVEQRIKRRKTDSKSFVAASQPTKQKKSERNDEVASPPPYSSPVPAEEEEKTEADEVGEQPVVKSFKDLVYILTSVPVLLEEMSWLTGLIAEYRV